MTEKGSFMDAVSALPWRPIDTAPKDGTRVLVWNSGVGHWIAEWRPPQDNEPQARVHTRAEWRDDAGCWATPTHWMPLPEPPNAGIERRAKHVRSNDLLGGASNGGTDGH